MINSDKQRPAFMFLRAQEDAKSLNGPELLSPGYYLDAENVARVAGEELHKQSKMLMMSSGKK